MHSDASTVSEYLGSLPADRRKAMAAVRKVIRANLPKGIVESMNWGMIVYEVPLRTYPDTYNGQPLAYAGLASQKNHMSVYLMGIYGSDALRAEFEDAYRRPASAWTSASPVYGSARSTTCRSTSSARPSAMTLEQFVALHDEASSMRKSNNSRRS